MLLAKAHTQGQPLSEAEHQQRVDAARRRWSAARLVGEGTALGAIAGWHAAVRRGTIRNAAQAEARAAISGANLIVENERIVADEIVDRDQRLAAIERAVRNRIQGPPRQRRDVMQTIQSMRNLEGGPPRSPLPPPVPIGAERDRRQLYNHEIARLQRRLRPRERALQRMVTAAGFEDDTREIRRARAEITSIKAEITENERLRDHASQPTARRGTTRQPTQVRATGKRQGGTRRGGEVQPTVTEQYRGGQTTAQFRRARAAAMARVHATAAHARANVLAASVETINREKNNAHYRMVRSLADAMQRGEIALKARGNRGALIGAGLGFSAAGLGLLAHHILSATRKRRVRKMVFADDLQKATRSRTASTAASLAATYRQWVDRLLGRSETPANLGDDLAAAIGPGITQDWADGYTNPPIDTEGSDPRYRIDVDFDVINPAVRRHMAAYALDRIIDITTAQREAIRTALMEQSVLQGIGPYDVARTIKASIGLTPYQQALVQSFRSQIVALDPRALNRNLRDKRFDPTLQRAIDSGTPLTDDQVNQMEDAYHRKALALRAATIARTESIRATTYGALARAQEVLDEHPELDVIKIWHSTHDDRTRDTHVDLDNKQADGMQTNFVTSKNNLIRWPFDERAPAEEVINCRCYLEYRYVPKRGQLMAVAV